MGYNLDRAIGIVDLIFVVSASPRYRQAHRLGDRLLDRERRCKGCDLTNGGPGEFALQLATMIDVTWPSGVSEP